MRVNRFTGRTEYFLGGRWYPDRTYWRKLDLAEIANVKIEGLPGHDSLFLGSITNDNDPRGPTVMEAVFEVVGDGYVGTPGKDFRQVSFKRKLTIPVIVPPGSSANFEVPLPEAEGLPPADLKVSTIAVLGVEHE
jgi:hypothetical protein